MPKIQLITKARSHVANYRWQEAFANWLQNMKTPDENDNFHAIWLGIAAKAKCENVSAQLKLFVKQIYRDKIYWRQIMHPVLLR